MKIYIIERNKRYFKYLYPYFHDCEDVILVNENLETFLGKNKRKIECVVSPANAFGLMDGGFDLALTEYFGDQLQQRVQQYIIKHYLGEQPVATSFIIETNKEPKYLIHTPTMRTPEIITDARIVYQCMRTTLLEAIHNNIKSIVIPMFATHTGMVKPQITAKMMYKAYMQIKNPPEKIDWDYAEKVDMLPEENFLQDFDKSNY